MVNAWALVCTTGAQTWQSMLSEGVVHGMSPVTRDGDVCSTRPNAMKDGTREVCFRPGSQCIRTASHIATSPPSPHSTHEYSHWLPDSSSCISSSPGDCSVSTRTGSSPQIVISSVWPARTVSYGPSCRARLGKADVYVRGVSRSLSVTHRRATPHNI